MQPPTPPPAFARDPGTAAYYDQRASEYDEWYEDQGQYAARRRPGWREDVQGLVALIQGLAPASTLDVACGTGYLTRHLRGRVVLAEARRVARQLVVVDSAWRPEIDAEQWQARVLNDGSRHRVYKRYLRPEQLADEIGGRVLWSGPWFVAAVAGP